MKTYIQLSSLQIPMYGLMIIVGVVLANIISFIMIKHYRQDINDFIIVEAYAILGGGIGAKCLYMIVAFDQIDWKRIFELEYFNGLMQGGFVFYGGLVGGFFCVWLGCKIHGISWKEYVVNYIFLIPFVHSFGRIGCFFAGCCYGISYNGIGCFVFPEGSLAPSYTPLFPIQLVEAFFLLLISGIMFVVTIKKKWGYTIEVYLLLYGSTRFALEFLRGDERGEWMILSTSQWISVVMIFVGIICLKGKRIIKA